MGAFCMNKAFSALFCMTQILLLGCSTHGLEDLEFADVSCNYSGITVDVYSEDYFDGVIYTQGNFFNPSCRYFAPLESESRNISFFLPLVDCGNLIRQLDREIYISNTVVIQKHRTVETSSDVVRNISCKLPYPDSLETEEFWTHGNHSSHFKNNVLESWMDFQLGSDILGKDVSNQLLVGDEFLIVIHLKDGGINKAMHVQSCWAYDGKSLKESQYTLHIYDRNTCKTSDWVSRFNLTKGMKNVSDTIIYAVIKAFKFPITKNVHITCSVQVCTSNCWDYCTIPEYLRSNAYPPKLKRSTPDGSSDNSLRERYRLMKATVKALAANIIESNKAHKSEHNSNFRRRISNPGGTSTQDYEAAIAAEEYDYYDKDYSATSNYSQSGVSTDSSYETESEYFTNDVYIFNVTNNVVVFTGHEFNFRQEYMAATERPAHCVSKVRFGIALAGLAFLVFCLIGTCIGLVLYMRKERKRQQINSFLLYNFY